jgi:VanZ family protein
MLKRLWPALIWALIILFLSAHPQLGVSRPQWWLQPDKIAHAGVYAILSFLMRYGIKSVYLPIVLGTVYGIGIEFMQQAFFYGRQLDLGDMLANAVGCVLGVWFFSRFAPYLPWARE